MPFFVLHHRGWNRPVTYDELLPAMQMPSELPCGLVLAKGIFGDHFRVSLGDMGHPVLFRDEQSALNGIAHLKKDMRVGPDTFELRPVPLA